MSPKIRHWLGGCALAGGLILSNPLHAQAQAPQTPGAVAASLGTHHKVIAAWLADPITYPYDLRAVARGETLEIHGTVPNEMLRKQALNIAKVAHVGPLTDRIEVIPSAPKPVIVRPAFALQTAVHARLERTLPRLASGVNVDCDAEGKVVLSGAVMKATDAYAVVVAVRGTTGCTSIVNNIPATTAPIISEGSVRPALHTVPATPPAAKAVTNDRTEAMRQLVARECPTTARVAVHQVGPNRFQVQLQARTDAEAARLATAIMNLPPLANLHIDIGVHIPR